MAKDSIFRLTDNGEIVRSHARCSNLDDIHKVDSVFLGSKVIVLILICCFAADFSAFYGMMSMLSFSTPFMTAAAVIGLLICFDISPVYLGLNEKRRKQGMEADKTMSLLALAAFVSAAAINTYLRWKMRFMLAGTVSASFGQSDISMISNDDMLTADTNAILFIILPAGTSLVSYLVSYLTYDPMGEMKLRLQKKIAGLDDEIIRVQAMLAEYSADSEYKEFQEQQENERLKTAQEQVCEKAVWWMNQTGLQLAAMNPDPASISAFTECTDQEKSQIRDAVEHITARVLHMNSENSADEDQKEEENA